jgi:hypothetical protein
MNLTRSSIQIVLMALVAVAATAVLLLWTHKMTVGRKLETLSIVNRTEICLAVIEDRYRSNILSTLGSMSGERLNHEIALLMQTNGVPVTRQRASDGQLFVMDAYKQPLRIILRDEALKENLPAELVGTKRRLIMYSYGPNKKDDNGRGDDIFWREP